MTVSICISGETLHPTFLDSKLDQTVQKIQERKNPIEGEYADKKAYVKKFRRRYLEDFNLYINDRSWPMSSIILLKIDFFKYLSDFDEILCIYKLTPQKNFGSRRIWIGGNWRVLEH
mgnify:CR=1 FL=1